MNDQQTPSKLIDQLRAWFFAKDRSVVLSPGTFIDAPEITTPGNPATNRRRIYPKAGGWYSLEDDGTETRFAEDGNIDAADVTYTPAVVGDWGGVDPGNVDDALDWIAANRVWHEIATTTLGASAASITLSAIPATYRHLVIYVALRTDAAAEADFALVRFNADAGANYDHLGQAFNTGGLATAATRAGTSGIATRTEAANSRASNFGPGIIHVTNYADTAKEKWCFCHQSASFGNVSADTDLAMNMDENRWRSTAAITSITLLPNTGPNFVSGSVVTLYGIL